MKRRKLSEPTNLEDNDMVQFGLSNFVMRLRWVELNVISSMLRSKEAKVGTSTKGDRNNLINTSELRTNGLDSELLAHPPKNNTSTCFIINQKVNGYLAEFAEKKIQPGWSSTTTHLVMSRITLSPKVRLVVLGVEVLEGGGGMS